MVLRPEASKVIDYLNAVVARNPTYDSLLNAFQTAGVKVERRGPCEAKVVDDVVSGVASDSNTTKQDVKLELVVDVIYKKVDDVGYMHQDVGIVGFVTPLRYEIVREGIVTHRHEPTSVHYVRRWTAKQPMHSVPTVARYEQVQAELEQYRSLKPAFQN